MNRVARLLGLSAGLLWLLTASAQDPDDIPANTFFPASNPWNWDVTGLPVHPGSDLYIAAIGASTHLREDYAFPYSVVDAAQAEVTVMFDEYPDESDYGNGAFGSNDPGGSATGLYPFPPGAPIEPGGDAHVLVVDTGNDLLYETYSTSGGPPWTAACGAVFDLGSNAMRPEGWTSSDAAGLPILPGLIRYDEAVTRGVIPHALRFTCSPTQNRHLYPARHHAGSANVNLPPMGLRLRLKASKDISGYTGAALAILTALKTHGMILADNGSDFYLSTTLDSRWNDPMNPTTIMDIRDMIGSDFEVVQTVDANGAPLMFAANNGVGPPPPPDPVAGGGGGGGGGCGCSGLEGLLVLALLRAIRRRV